MKNVRIEKNQKICAADQAGRDAAAATAAAAAVCCSMIIYIYAYYLIAKGLAYFHRKINCSEKVNHLLRKYVFSFENMTFPKKVNDLL